MKREGKNKERGRASGREDPRYRGIDAPGHLS